MRTIVITAPVAAVTASEAKASKVFPAGDDDPYVEYLLAVAQATVDGPDGWLLRAIGKQTLELQADCFSEVARCDGRISLAYRPAKDIASVKYDDLNGVEQTISNTNYSLKDERYLVPASGYSWPRATAIRVRYEAGEETANVPKGIKHGLILTAAEIKAAGGITTTLRSETVEGVGRFDYALPDIALQALRSAAERHLMAYRNYSI